MGLSPIPMIHSESMKVRIYWLSKAGNIKDGEKIPPFNGDSMVI